MVFGYLFRQVNAGFSYRFVAIKLSYLNRVIKKQKIFQGFTINNIK